MPDGEPAAISRLVTTVDLDGRDPGPRQIWLSALLEVELVDGSRVLLLDDRGWSTSGRADPWAQMSVADLEGTARMVVGPDEPARGRTQDQERAAHWDALAGELRRSGVATTGDKLQQLPHDVVLTDRVRARLPGSGGAVPGGW